MGTTFNTDFPAPASRKVATNQHVLSFNPLTRASRRRGERVKAPHPEAARACGWDPSRAGEAEPIRIGYEHPDRLVSYPDRRFLSGCDTGSPTPPTTPTLPGRQAKKSPHNQHVAPSSRYAPSPTRRVRHPAPPRRVLNVNGGRAPSVRGPRLRARPQSAGRSDLARHFYGSPKTPQ